VNLGPDTGSRQITETRILSGCLQHNWEFASHRVPRAADNSSPERRRQIVTKRSVWRRVDVIVSTTIGADRKSPARGTAESAAPRDLATDPASNANAREPK
jgi:hypothetical protein